MNNQMKKYISFNPFECDAVKDLLEEYALMGWKLSKISTTSFYL